MESQKSEVKKDRFWEKVEVVDKLPTPEEVFKVPKMTIGKKLALLYGSAVIALGVSVGSGEFLLGPNMSMKVGMGIFWLVWIGAFLQTVYIHSWTKISIAFGETPITTMWRIAPTVGIIGSLLVFFGFIWGGWAYTSASALAGGIMHRLPTAQDKPVIVASGVLLLALTFIILTLGKRVARTLEIFNWFDIAVLFTSFIVFAIILVPRNIWLEGFKGLISVGNIPPGIDYTSLAAWWGYIGFATGINYILVNYFKDKGYGMGSLTGYIPAIVGGKTIKLEPWGKTFKLTPENLSVFKRWYRYAAEELFGVFFVGAVIGMFVPPLLAYGIAKGLGITTAWNIPLWLAFSLEKIYGTAGYWWGVIVAILVLFKTQLGITDALVRALIDSLWKSEKVRKWAKEDVRRIYYVIVAVYLAWASVAMVASAPLILIIISANIANFAALISIPVLMYINSKMPKDLKIGWGYMTLNIILMIICGIFFIASIGHTLGFW